MLQVIRMDITVVIVMVIMAMEIMDTMEMADTTDLMYIINMAATKNITVTTKTITVTNPIIQKKSNDGK